MTSTIHPELEPSRFTASVRRHHRELHVHCYRMLGSFEESEDLVQETFLRAWRMRHTYAGRSSLRAWLYKIATNACLDALDKRPRRVSATGEVSWLQPYPDELLEELPGERDDPEAAAVEKETIVLSEVSPPTALSAFAAAAITRGNAFKTMMLTWKYTLPAFLVPFAFVLTDNGEGLLLQGSIGTVLLASAVSAIAVGALAIATGAWLLGPARLPERVVCGAAGLILLYLEPLWIAIGLGVLALGVVAHVLGRRQVASDPRGAQG